MAPVVLAVLVLHALLLWAVTVRDGSAGAASGAATRASVQVRQVVLGAAPEPRPSPTPAAAAPRPADTLLATSAPATVPVPGVGAVPSAPIAALTPRLGTDSSTGPSVAAAGVAGTAAGGEAPVVYRTQLPEATTLHYSLRRGQAGGTATLSWAPESGRYRIELNTQAFGTELLGRTSSGSIDAHGLAPERHAELRRGREVRAANFERSSRSSSDAGPSVVPAVGASPDRIRFSARSTEQPLPPGAQDRVSWMLQLAAVMAANPQLGLPGQQVRLFVAGTRGDAQWWTFEVLGPTEAELADGSRVPALHLRREPRQPYDTTAQVWLDPARQWLPVRALLMVRPTGEGVEFVLERSQPP